MKECHDTGEEVILLEICVLFSYQNQTHITSLEKETNFSLKAVLTDMVKNTTVHP